MRRHGVELNWWTEEYRDANSMSRLLGEVEYGVGLKPTVAGIVRQKAMVRDET